MTEAIERTIAQLDVLLRAHAGGIELRDVDHEGHVVVRYTGMCAGCPWKPLTTGATVRPALMAADGVKTVEVEGSRISEEAQLRIAAAFGQTGYLPVSASPSPEPRSPRG